MNIIMNQTRERTSSAPSNFSRHHVEQLRYVVVELKSGKFQPEWAGRLQFYVALDGDKLRRPLHAPLWGS